MTVPAVTMHAMPVHAAAAPDASRPADRGPERLSHALPPKDAQPKDVQPKDVQRRDRILDAAAVCFVRHGFHRTTMQDVAAEAGMSAGNLYRYFPSKDAMVEGLVERDRRMIRDDFGALARAADPMATFAELGRRHLIEEPRARAILTMEIWAEASRNERVASLCRMVEAEVETGIASFVTQARARFGVTGPLSPTAIARLMMIIANGCFTRRAIDPAFDGPAAHGLIVETIFAAIGLAPDAVSSPSPAKSP